MTRQSQASSQSNRQTRTLAKTIDQLGILSGRSHRYLKIILIFAALSAPAAGFYYSGRYGFFLGITIMLGLLGWATLFSVLSGKPPTNK